MELLDFPVEIQCRIYHYLSSETKYLLLSLKNNRLSEILQINSIWSHPVYINLKNGHLYYSRLLQFVKPGTFIDEENNVFYVDINYETASANVKKTSATEKKIQHETCESFKSIEIYFTTLYDKTMPCSDMIFVACLDPWFRIYINFERQTFYAENLNYPGIKAYYSLVCHSDPRIYSTLDRSIFIMYFKKVLYLFLGKPAENTDCYWCESLGNFDVIDDEPVSDLFTVIKTIPLNNKSNIVAEINFDYFCSTDEIQMRIL